MILSSLFLLWGREAWHTATLFQEPIYLLSGFYFPVRALGAVAAALAGTPPDHARARRDPADPLRQGRARGFLPLAWIPPIQTALLVLFLFLAHRRSSFMENLGKREGRLDDPGRVSA